MTLNQKKRIQFLEKFENAESMDEYLNLCLKQMDDEFRYYEDEFTRVLEEIDIDKDIWDGSNEAYLN